MLHFWYWWVSLIWIKISWNGGIVDCAITSLTNKQFNNNLIWSAILRFLLVLQISLTFYLLYLKFLILKAWFCSGSNFLKMVLFWPHIWQEYIRWECVHSVFKINFPAYCRILLNIPIDLLSFHFNELIWRFQSRCSPKTKPRYLTLLQVLIFSPLILKFSCFVICFCLGLKIIISVLLVLRLILFARSH